MTNQENTVEKTQAKSSSVTTPRPSSSTTTNSQIPYMLFIYREELRKSQGRLLKLSKTKLNLTQEMVSYSVDRITEYDVEELININRQISFTRKLKLHMDHMKKQMQSMRISQQSPLVKRCVTS